MRLVSSDEASWRSGYAEDCKSLHPGSIPGEASNTSIHFAIYLFLLIFSAGVAIRSRFHPQLILEASRQAVSNTAPCRAVFE